MSPGPSSLCLFLCSIRDSLSLCEHGNSLAPDRSVVDWKSHCQSSLITSDRAVLLRAAASQARAGKRLSPDQLIGLQAGKRQRQRGRKSDEATRRLEKPGFAARLIEFRISSMFRTGLSSDGRDVGGLRRLFLSSGTKTGRQQTREGGRPPSSASAGRLFVRFCFSESANDAFELY